MNKKACKTNKVQKKWDIAYLLLVIHLLLPIHSSGLDKERFFRIMELYQDAAYRLGDGELRGAVSAKLNKTEVISDTISSLCRHDDHFASNRSLNGRIESHYRRTRGNSQVVRDFFAAIRGSGVFENNEEIDYNAFSQLGDTLRGYHNQAMAEVKTHYSHEHFFNNRKHDITTFIDILFGMDAQAIRDRHGKRQYRGSPFGNTEYHEKMRRYSGAITGEIGFGYGKQIPVNHIYRAFEIERALRESGVIQGNLSDSTILDLAYWLANEWVLVDLHERPEKFFYSALNHILASDSAFYAPNMNSYSVMKVRDKVNHDYPFIKKGLKIRLSSNYTINNTYEKTGRWYGTSDTTDFGPGLISHHFASFFTPTVSIGVPALPWLFFASELQSGALLNTDVGLRLRDSFDTFFWNFDVFFLVTEKVMVHGKINRWELSKNTSPQSILARFRYYVEDNIYLDVDFTYEWIRHTNFDYYSYPNEKKHEGTVMLGLVYDL